MHLDDTQAMTHALTPGKPALRQGESEDASEAFEALFVGEIFKAMRATVHESDDNFGKSVFTSMLDEQLAHHIAESGGLGLTSVLHQELDEKNLKV